MLGDFLYQLSARDEVSNAIVPATRSIDVPTVTNEASGLLLQVPTDQVFVVTAFSVYALADPATTPRITRLFVQDFATNRSVDLWADYWGAFAAGTNYASSSRSLTGQVFVPPGWGVLAQAFFVGAAANNRLSAQILGYFLPKGNLSLP